MRSTGVFWMQELIKIRIEAKDAISICFAGVFILFRFLQPFHYSALEVVESRHHKGVQVFDDGVFLDESGPSLRMAAGVVVNAVRCVDGRLDTSCDGHDVVRQCLAYVGGGDCAATRMAHYDDQRGP